MNKATERVAAVRDVLRHLKHPERLRHTPLVASQFSPDGDPAGAAARVERLIENALAELPVRLREIVRRCDFCGELHAAVMAALGLSKRHFYRERLRALEAIGVALAGAAPAIATPVYVGTPDALALQLCAVDAAYQLGDIDGAVRTIRDASRQIVDQSEHVYLECRLAEIRCEGGDVLGARGHIAKARALATDLGDERALVTGRIDAMEGLVAWRTGDCAFGAERSERALFALRREVGSRVAPRDAEALACALLVISKRDLSAGKSASARRHALEACEAIAGSATAQPALRIRLRCAATVASMHDPARLRDAAFELEMLYRDAIAGGLTLEATIVGCCLSNVHRFAGNPRRAISALQSMLPVARNVLKGDERAGISLDLAINYVACGEPAEAHRTIAEARAHANPAGFVAALSHLISADACLAERHYARAVSRSRDAVEAMRRLGRQTSIGPALRVQADAIHALGDIRAASDVIEEALSSLDRVGHPYLRATAYRSAAKITGNRAHRRVADDLFVALRPAAV